MTKTLVIKRYPNRKLYNTETHHYVTVIEVANLALGREIMVIDNVSKRDVTKKTICSGMLESVGDSFFAVSELIEVYRKIKDRSHIMDNTINRQV